MNLEPWVGIAPSLRLPMYFVRITVVTDMVLVYKFAGVGNHFEIIGWPFFELISTNSNTAEININRVQFNKIEICWDVLVCSARLYILF